MNLIEQLAVFNSITFVESSHLYLIDGAPTTSPSVTRLIKTFKSEFDKKKMSEKVARKRGVSVDDVLQEWEKANVFSTTLGSILHKYIENFYNNKKIEIEFDKDKLDLEHKKKLLETLPVLIKFFHNFYSENKHLLLVRNEMVIGDISDTKVCGMLDMLSFNTQTNSFEILDFKTNKKMEKDNKWRNKLFYPFEHMSESEVTDYTIQLNTYKYILQKYTSLDISKMKLVWFNAANSDYKIIELENIQPQIKLMFETLK